MRSRPSATILFLCTLATIPGFGGCASPTTEDEDDDVAASTEALAAQSERCQSVEFDTNRHNPFDVTALPKPVFRVCMSVDRAGFTRLTVSNPSYTGRDVTVKAWLGTTDWKSEYGRQQAGAFSKRSGLLISLRTPGTFWWAEVEVCYGVACAASYRPKL